ncbi:hypothetical protein CRYUN_Cryun30bG0025300 [Craigia yunnanensis]
MSLSTLGYEQIEDLTSEEQILPQFGIDPEEIQAIDAKIRQWSNGKQGNIRSLLSTLQYYFTEDVTPILRGENLGLTMDKGRFFGLVVVGSQCLLTLVDIIEGPAVKRSYQKALLCLHPDKLQQRGAASDKKNTLQKMSSIFCRMHGLISTHLVWYDLLYAGPQRCSIGRQKDANLDAQHKENAHGN